MASRPNSSLSSAGVCSGNPAGGASTGRGASWAMGGPECDKFCSAVRASMRNSSNAIAPAEPPAALTPVLPEGPRAPSPGAP
eukprot:12470529-Alexandrium_andersonii.AAC.2